MNIGSLALDALVVGLPYTLDFLGVWLIYRLLNDFDMTVDGAFTMGAAVTAALITFHGFNPLVATVVAAVAGAGAGLLTAFVHLRMGVPLLLAGIISMIGLYSVNLRIMGDAPNIALVQAPTLFSAFSGGSPLTSELETLAFLAVLVGGVIVLLGLFLKTQVGLSLRATGANRLMARSVGVNTGLAVLLFLLIGNLLASLSGAVTAQEQSFADINMGIGVILIGIAAILLGEVVLRRSGTVWAGAGAVVIGTILYFVVVSIVLRLGMNPTDLRALTSVVLLIAIGASMSITWTDQKRRPRRRAILPANEPLRPETFREAGSLSANTANHEAAAVASLQRHPISAPKVLGLALGTASASRTNGSTSSSSLSLRRLTVTYNEGMPNQVTALRSLVLDVPPGQFLTIIGSNGAGKSTLVSAIAGSVRATAGTLWLGNHDITNVPEHRRAQHIARVFQDPAAGTCATFSIEENLALAERRDQSRGLSLAVTSRNRARYVDYLRQFNLGFESRLSDKVGVLSGGQRQALALLMAVMNAPDVLLLDEHVAALDPRNQAMLQEMTEALAQEHRCTTIMVTHDMQSAIRYGDRMIMMHRGTVLFDVEGEAKRILTVEKLVAAFNATDRSALSDEMVLG